MTEIEAIAALTMCQELMLFDPLTGDTHELWQENKDNQDLFNACDLGIKALKEKQEREKPQPLTLEELKQLDNENFIYVYDKWHNKFYPCIKSCLEKSCFRCTTAWGTHEYYYKHYGKTWLVYLYKLKEE